MTIDEKLFGTKAFLPFSVKKGQLEGDSRTFEGMAAAWSLDQGDDVIHKGAFAKSLKEWRGSGRELKLLDSHHTGSVVSAVGKLVDGSEEKEGLWTKWELLPGDDVAEQVRQRIKFGIVDALSIGFLPRKFDFEENAAARFGAIRHLREIDLKEVSVVLFPMNEDALIDPETVKAGIAAGRYTPRELDDLAKFHARLGEVLKSASPPSPAPDDGPDVTRLDALRVQRLRQMAR